MSRTAQKSPPDFNLNLLPKGLGPVRITPTHITIKRLPPKHRWTDSELQSLPKEGIKYELLDGELLLSPASMDHGAIITRLIILLGMHVEQHDLGTLYDGQTGFKLAPNIVLSPDIGFVTKNRVPPRPKKLPRKAHFFPGAPDLAIEVLSPGETSATINQKMKTYFAHGTRLAWVIDPYSQSATIYRHALPDGFISSKGSLSGDPLIPHFSLPLARLFKL